MPRKKKEEEILEVQEEVSDTVSDSGNDVLSAMTGQASQAGFGLAAGSGKKTELSELCLGGGAPPPSHPSPGPR